jgi:hypothetical protein
LAGSAVVRLRLLAAGWFRAVAACCCVLLWLVTVSRAGVDRRIRAGVDRRIRAWFLLGGGYAEAVLVCVEGGALAASGRFWLPVWPPVRPLVWCAGRHVVGG